MFCVFGEYRFVGRGVNDGAISALDPGGNSATSSRRGAEPLHQTRRTWAGLPRAEVYDFENTTGIWWYGPREQSVVAPTKSSLLNARSTNAF
jgi:hypothetical protein